MFPGSRGQSPVYGASYVTITSRLGGGQPGIHDQARAGIEFVGLAGGVDGVHAVQESGGGDLGGLLGGRVKDPGAPHGRGHGVHGHSIVARHGVGKGRVPSLGVSRPVDGDLRLPTPSSGA
jgi:hypothetical protein